MPEQFDIMGSGYEQTLLSHPHIRQDEVNHIVSSVFLRDGYIVLDFAAGSGFLSLKLLEKIGAEGQIIAVDSSSVMLDFLTRKALGNPRIRCLETSDPRLECLQSDSVDRITSLGGFHHVEDQVSTVRSFMRILRPGGMAMVIDFTDGTPAQRHFDGLVHEYNPTGHAALFLSQSRAVNLARFASCTQVSVASRRFCWRFADTADVGAYFVKHHGLRCTPREAAERIFATFDPAVSDDRSVAIEFDYTEMVLRKPA